MCRLILTAACAGGGGYHWFKLRAVPLRDEAGQVVKWFGTCTDITVLVEAQEALTRRQHELEGLVQECTAEVERLKNKLQEEDFHLREKARVSFSHHRTVGQSQAIRRVLAQVEQVAPTDSTVLLLGETGTGKELLAATIHELSSRRDRTMVSVNCAVMPSALVESELFGREKGAFTGSLSRQIGRFELANHSTIFLDEVGELPSEVQAKILRVLDAKQIERLGNPKPVSVDVRIIAATNRDLEKAVAEGKFRLDLYYRLNVFPSWCRPCANGARTFRSWFGLLLINSPRPSTRTLNLLTGRAWMRSSAIPGRATSGNCGTLLNVP